MKTKRREESAMPEGEEGLSGIKREEGGERQIQRRRKKGRPVRKRDRPG